MTQNTPEIKDYPTVEQLKNKVAIADSYEAAKANATPMMAQYFEIKERYNDYLLFYRMGDFYELFFDDAVVAADILEIALTRRGKHDGDEIPMCGVPHHSHEAYLHKLINSGQKVAICEQMESPAEAKKRGAKSVVKRDVVRVITPGTLTEESLLDAKSHNYLLSLVVKRKTAYLAWADISTGEFYYSSCLADDAHSHIARVAPKEIIAADSLPFEENWQWLHAHYRDRFTGFVKDFFEPKRTAAAAKDFFETESLDVFGLDDEQLAAAVGSLVAYIQLTQINNRPRLEAPKRYAPHDYMAIDAATRQNLELVRTLSGEYKGSLLSVINRTVTAPGARLLMHYVQAPLMQVAPIVARQDVVEFLLQQPMLRRTVRERLKHTSDIERAVSRLCIGRANPRDLAAIRESLEQLIEIIAAVQNSEQGPALLKQIIDDCGEPDALYKQLKDALKDEVASVLREGNFIRDGYHEKLDHYRHIKLHAGDQKQALQDRYVEETGIKNLKIKHNNVLGYFIEITAQHMDKIPEHFTHRQTLASAVRYSSDELRTLEEEMIHADSNMLELELQLYHQLVKSMVDNQDYLVKIARALAQLDVLAGLAELAENNRYVRPTIDESDAFDIREGRHPVVEANVSDPFVANDCRLEQQERIWLITGPNMAGKSTFLRQNALVTILAQMGCFVPAKTAHIGLVDRVFSRVGAADDLARGQSTFMVEMLETATILHQATEKSLVILDEIGRGTATFDGLAIAWAVVEHLHQKTQCRSLFATHYHELTSLETKLKALACYTVAVKEWEQDVIFLHEMKPGKAERSYGIHVAKLAGVPKPVLRRAEEIMTMLSQSETQQVMSRVIEELPLFAGSEGQNALKDDAQSTGEKIHPAIAKLQAIDVDGLSPKEALIELYELAELAEDA